MIFVCYGKNDEQNQKDMFILFIPHLYVVGCVVCLKVEQVWKITNFLTLSLFDSFIGQPLQTIKVTYVSNK